jgi:starch synthase
MDILFATTELFPWIKVGGLADVASALPKALHTLGHRVTIVAPKFSAFEASGLLLGRRLTPVGFQFAGQAREAIAYDARLPSQVDLCLLEIGDVFATDDIYGGTDAERARRFGLFSAAVAQLASGFEVLHLSDWPTALAARFAQDLAPDARVVLTVHNLAHQGVFESERLADLGLTVDAMRADGVELDGKVNLLKQGLIVSHAVSTVSPTYATEILSEPHGQGLSAVLGALPNKLVGILNGIDYAVWNPATDASLATRFDAENLSPRVRCSTALQRELGLAVDDRAPIVAFVGRLRVQKGVDSLASAVPSVLRGSDAQFVFAGDGDPALAEALAALAERFPGRVAFLAHAPEAVVHRIFGGAALVVVPSRHEPCGLVQMYAQRYGAIPVVHATGGLSDTVVDCDAQLETGTGIVFDEVSEAAIEAAILRGLAAIRHPRAAVLLRRIMRLDRGWDRAARQYERLYRRS